MRFAASPLLPPAASAGNECTDFRKFRETWFGAEVNRMAGVIALMSVEPDAAKAQEYFERALAVARQLNGRPTISKRM